MKYSIENLINENIPKCSGIYFIWRNENLIYIGSSQNFRKRLNITTIYQRFVIHGLTHVQFLFTENFIELEKQLIKFFQPIANGTYNPNFKFYGQTRTYKNYGSKLGISLTGKCLELFNERKAEFENLHDLKLSNAKFTSMLIRQACDNIEEFIEFVKNNPNII